MATVYTLAQWNALLQSITNLGCGSLPPVTAPHRWSVADIKAAQAACPVGPTSGSYTTPAGPPYLWQQKIIDELNQAIAQGCCNNYFVNLCICNALDIGLGCAGGLSIQHTASGAAAVANAFNQTPIALAGIEQAFVTTKPYVYSGASGASSGCIHCTCKITAWDAIDLIQYSNLTRTGYFIYAIVSATGVISPAAYNAWHTAVLNIGNNPGWVVGQPYYGYISPVFGGIVATQSWQGIQAAAGPVLGAAPPYTTLGGLPVTYIVTTV